MQENYSHQEVVTTDRHRIDSRLQEVATDRQKDQYTDVLLLPRP
jgi:hypothetical protein